MTIWIAAVSVGLSIPVGLLCGWLMTLRNPVIRFVMRVYLDFIRIMPQLALLFIAFYGIARMSSWNMDATASCVFVFVLWAVPSLAISCAGAPIDPADPIRDLLHAGIEQLAGIRPCDSAAGGSSPPAGCGEPVDPH